MDLLFKRYASPFSILEGYIQTGRFCEFIERLDKIKHKEDVYDLWLHRVFDESYEEFSEGLKTSESVQSMTYEDMETTVQHSQGVLSGFNPNILEGSDDNGDNI